MVVVPAGNLHMGSDSFYPEERPRRTVTVGSFRLMSHPVTNDEFSEFVDATAYVTLAERPLDPSEYPGADPSLLHPGGVVFRRPPGPVPLDDPSRWWAYVPGASWRHPTGPDSDLTGLEDHPVVQVSFPDAEAYAAWRGLRLPTEVEWEWAARGGLIDAEYAWGSEPYPDGRQAANTWQGRFPWEDLTLDGWSGTSPVGTYPPNGYGLFDVTGNVWEWTSDWWTGDHGSMESAESRESADACCGGVIDLDRSSAAPGERYGRKVIKGGSHLCAPNYCHRFRPAARQPEAVDTSTCHIGFRCAADI